MKVEVAQGTLQRRSVLGGVMAGVIGGAITVARPAEATTTPTVTKTVTQYIALAYTYNATTHVTTVTKHRAVTVVARFVGSAVYLKNRVGVWVRVPYQWSTYYKGLWYSHYLDLLLHPAPKPVGVSPNTPYVSTDVARHLLRRATFGVSAASLAEVKSLGVDEWLTRQLLPSTLADPVGDALAARLPYQSLPIWQVNDYINTGVISGWQQMMDVRTAFTMRAAWSSRQLQTVMEDFWSSHFNVTCPGDPIGESRAHYQNTIRANALGKFSKLLPAVTMHPSMLTYLNNRDSTWQHPNENHGRELLELHTVGVGAGYGEAGVLDSARILTGLSVSSDSGEFLYEPWRHWTGPVTVLGFTDSNASQSGGLSVATRYLDYLAHHPATAHRLATKLAVHFVSDSPSAALVSSLASTYLAYDTAIAPVLWALFHSSEFLASTGKKVRRPFESLVATVRLLGYGPQAAPGVDAVEALNYQAGDAGQAPFAWGPPDGYPDLAPAWASTAVTISRWNTTLDVAAGWWPNNLARPVLEAFLFGSTLPTTHGALVDAAARKLFDWPLAPNHRAAVLTFLGVAATDPVNASSDAVGWQLPYWIALLLDSPYHLYR